MDETIDIYPCPVCTQAHTYLLRVGRDVSAGLMTARSEPMKAVVFTRLFTCPEKGQDFQGRITLYQGSRNRIRSVLVVGIVEVSEDG